MKIMIVDDEVIIRTGLAQVIKWKELGLSLLEPAASAEEALRRIPAEKPDILLTDIQMGGKTGLQLAEEAKQELPNLEVIILSGYDDFVYTQQAIRQEVLDYLLKTSRPEDIIKTVLRAKQRIEEKWAVQSQDRFKHKEVRNRIYERLLAGEWDGTDSERLAEYLPLFAEGNGEAGQTWRMLLIEAEGWGDTPSFESLLLFAVENMLVELLPCETLLQKKRLIAAVPGRQELKAGMERIERLLKCKLFAAAGGEADSIMSLSQSYAEAEHVVQYKPLLQQSYCDIEEIRQRKGGKTVIAHEEELELSSILLDDDPVPLKQWVHRLVHSLLEDPQVTLESFQAYLQSVAVAGRRWLDRVAAATGKDGLMKEDMPELYEAKADEAPKESLYQHLHQVMKLYHTRLAEGRASHVQRAMAYIEESLGSDVTLQHVAKYVHLHPGHLSEVFKKETGMTFGDFVTKQKLRRAMEILTVSPSKISDVAAAVGYDDVKYFGQLFKKFTGKTPSEFREEAGERKRG
jgi:two-component system, response regulator YesN